MQNNSGGGAAAAGASSSSTPKRAHVQLKEEAEEPSSAATPPTAKTLQSVRICGLDGCKKPPWHPGLCEPEVLVTSTCAVRRSQVAPPGAKLRAAAAAAAASPLTPQPQSSSVASASSAAAAAEAGVLAEGERLGRSLSDLEGHLEEGKKQCVERLLVAEKSEESV